MNISKKAVALVLMSALCTTTGQLFWKLSAESSQRPFWIILGFGLYAIGAISLINAMRYGEMSVVHPMMSIGFIFTLLNGNIFLGEQVTSGQVLGVCIIMLGIWAISRKEVDGG